MSWDGANGRVPPCTNCCSLANHSAHLTSHARTDGSTAGQACAVQHYLRGCSGWALGGLWKDAIWGSDRIGSDWMARMAHLSSFLSLYSILASVAGSP